MEKLVLFGDSITAGYGEEAMSPILQNTIQSQLKEADYEEIQIINAGMLGHTTEDAKKRIRGDVIEEAPTMVTIFFGANDVSQDSLVPLNRYSDNLCKMIQMIGKEKVFLITPPYIICSRNPSRDERRIEDYVKSIKRIGSKWSLPVIDLYHSMLEQADPEKLLQIDGLHFSFAGYTLLASLIVQEIKGRLIKKRK